MTIKWSFTTTKKEAKILAIEFKPLGNACNIGCKYCYQEPMRLAGNTSVSKGYDIDKMIEIADNSGIDEPFVVFGGESLLIPKKDLERIFKASYERKGEVSIQSNGSLIDDEHIELFKKYNVHVGVSIDGANDLNEMRASKQKNKTTLELTNASVENLAKLARNNISCGVIFTVHKLNGTKENLPRLQNFIRWLGDMGIKGGNLHMLEVDSGEASDYILSPEENEFAFQEMAKFFDKDENKDLQYHPFVALEGMMRGNDEDAHCIWKSCDSMNTGAVYGIEGNGQISNCGMVNKEGIEWTKADDTSRWRDLILYQTPPEKGGCKGCPFFIMCNGYCTGASIDSDWRNKTYYCSSLKKMFKYYEGKIENEGLTPYSKRPDRSNLEKAYIDSLMREDARLSMKEIEEISMSPMVVAVKGGN
jgi:uncharacterized protein